MTVTHRNYFHYEIKSALYSEMSVDGRLI